MSETDPIPPQSGATHADIKRVEDSVDRLAGIVADGFEKRDEEISKIHEEAKKDRLAAAKNLNDATDKIFNAIKHNDEESLRRWERASDSQKPQWRVLISLLALIFVVMSALFGEVKLNIARVESDAKERDAAVDTIVQREMRLLDESIIDKAKANREDIHEAREVMRRFQLEQTEKHARTDERVKMLWELRVKSNQ